MEINIKRAYDRESPQDGYRIYVDRIWPRGLSHSTFTYDEWDKDIAPSNELRHWFHEDTTGRWDEFRRRYAEELGENPAFAKLKETIKTKAEVTLLYSSHDSLHNNAVVVRDMLLRDGD